MRWISLLAIALVANSCSKNPDAVQPPASGEARSVGATDRSAERVGNDIRSALEQQKQESLHNLQARADELAQRISSLRDDLSKVSDAARASCEAQLRVLGEKHQGLLKKIQELRATAGEMWKDAAGAVEKGFAEVERGLDSLVARMK